MRSCEPGALQGVWAHLQRGRAAQTHAHLPEERQEEAQSVRLRQAARSWLRRALQLHHQTRTSSQGNIPQSPNNLESLAQQNLYACGADFVTLCTCEALALRDLTIHKLLLAGGAF